MGPIGEDGDSALVTGPGDNETGMFGATEAPRQASGTIPYSRQLEQTKHSSSNSN